MYKSRKLASNKIHILYGVYEHYTLMVYIFHCLKKQKMIEDILGFDLPLMGITKLIPLIR